jgi:hypothetical protein
MPGLYSIEPIPYGQNDFAEVQWQLEATASGLKTANDPEFRRKLLRKMSRLIAEAERISSQPPKMSHKPGHP